MRTFRHGSPVPIADIEASFDHSISESYQRGRNSEAQRLCCPDVNHQLIFRWQLNWKIARLLALENTRCINTSAAVSVGLTCSVTYQAASIYKSTQIITRWDGVRCCRDLCWNWVTRSPAFREYRVRRRGQSVDRLVVWRRGSANRQPCAC